ncbi:LysR family transcriptional regulator [Ancylobacter defluvii]|uniref:LysR family transcriptional regulator n=1 Tax=Ancylobacter defluvii TaxID=1282440 RepID=A0A9W6JVU2_9HYPH|nr:LysR family transcriptional regulator [Ancylobacter defluvii]MBS7590172.1 LysR family transcriptional regulator [Ancylobacter defluvii]GLK82804.1 LysR family transcriptional regulator [Ancylobacter defluvii]
MTPTVQGSEFAQLRTFVTVAELLSFSRAAERLGVTPSSLSQTIRNLEERLGIRLLNRTTRSVALTPAGETLLLRLRPAMDEINAALASATRFRDTPAGTVRVHAARLAAQAFVLPMLGAFSRSYPEITVDVTVDDAVVDIVSGGWDVAIRPGEVVERDMIAVEIGGPLVQYPVATPDYIARRGTPKAPEQLLDHNCILWRWAGQSLPYAWEFCRNGNWFELVVKGTIIVSDRAMMLAACLDGAGIAFATNREADALIAEGRLVRMLDPYCEPYPGYFLCYPRQRQMAPALRAFMDALRMTARQDP